MLESKEAKWVVGVVVALLVLAGVAKVGWWLGTRGTPTVEADPVAVVPPTPVAAPAVAPVAAAPAVDPQVTDAQPNNFNQGNNNNNNGFRRNFQQQQLTPEQQQQLQDQRAAATQRMADNINNMVNNTVVDPNTNTMTINGPNGPRQIQLPQNLQITTDANGRPGAITLPNGGTIQLGGPNGINLGGLRNRSRGGNNGNNNNGGNGQVDPNAGVDPNAAQNNGAQP